MPPLRLTNNSKIRAPKDMEENKQTIMYFDTDEDFQNFCVLPYTTLEKSPITGEPYQQWHFTKEYLDAVAAGTRFKIRNEDSVIYKRGMVTGPNGIGLKVQNLDHWFEDDEE